jgi:hypothetical protein
MDLIMPALYKRIVVKIVSDVYIAGDDAYVNVIMYGNPQKWTYRMKLGKTLWFSIQKHLEQMDNNRFSEELEPAVLENNLEYLKGRVITIYGVPDSLRTFVKKDGTTESPKIFSVTFEPDLEDAERIGGDVYKKAIGNAVFNVMCEQCVIANSNLAKFEIEKEKEKSMTPEEIKKKRWEESEEEWVVKKREENKKNEKQLKQLDLAGWE